MRRSFACLIALAVAAPAAAQELYTVAPPPAADVGEPHADRVLLAPTAYTHPRGTFFVSDYDILFLQVGYALTDHTQVAVTATPPIGQPGEVKFALLDASLKTSLVRQGLVRVAALGSVSGLASDDHPGLVLAGRVGGVVQLCLHAACTSSLSMSSNLLLAGPVLLLGSGVGAVVRAGRYVSFMAEADTVVPLGSEAGSTHAALVGGGVRVHLRRVALDIGLLGGTAALPLVAFTYRTAN